MIAKQMGTQQASSKTIARWSAYLEELHARIAHRFVSPEIRQRAYRYLAGLRGEFSGAKTLLLRGPLRGRRRVVFPSRWSHLSPMSSGSASGR